MGRRIVSFVSDGAAGSGSSAVGFPVAWLRSVLFLVFYVMSHVSFVFKPSLEIWPGYSLEIAAAHPWLLTNYVFLLHFCYCEFVCYVWFAILYPCFSEVGWRFNATCRITLIFLVTLWRCAIQGNLGNKLKISWTTMKKNGSPLICSVLQKQKVASEIIFMNSKLVKERRSMFESHMYCTLSEAFHHRFCFLFQNILKTMFFNSVSKSPVIS